MEIDMSGGSMATPTHCLYGTQRNRAGTRLDAGRCCELPEISAAAVSQAGPLTGLTSVLLLRDLPRLACQR